MSCWTPTHPSSCKGTHVLSLRQLSRQIAILLVTGTVAFGQGDYHTLVANDNPFAHYHLDETSGATAADQTGNHHATYVNGPSLGQTGVYNGAVGLNGAAINPSHIAISNGLGSFGSAMNTFTFEAVFQTPAYYSGQGHLLHMANSGADKAAFSVWFNSDLSGNSASGHSRLFVRDSGGTSLSALLSNDLFDGSYHHLMVTYDSSASSSANRLKAYVDGAQSFLSFGTNGTPTQFSDYTNPVTLGVVNNGSAWPTQVNLDEAAFYTQALSSNDAQRRADALGLHSSGGGTTVLSSGITPAEVQNRRYLSYVTEALDTLMIHGTDRYGSSTNDKLLVSVMDVRTKDVVTPQVTDAPWRVDRYERRSPNGHNFLHDQDTLRVLRNVSIITGDGKYAQFAEDYTQAATALIDSNGMFWWGWHRHYDVTTDQKTGHINNYHEIHSINHPDWAYLYSVNPQGTQAEIEQIWQRHVVNKTTGEINRHDDGQAGKSFLMSSGAYIEAFAAAYVKTNDSTWLDRAKLLAEYNWNKRNTTTNLLAGTPNETLRWDGFRATPTLAGLYAPSLLNAWQITGDTTFRDQALAYLKAYADHAYDQNTGSFWASLMLDGTPVPGPRLNDGSYDQYEPRGHVDLWQPYVAGYEHPIAAAQAYALAYKLTGDADMLSAAEKWATLILANFPANVTLQDAWYDGYSDAYAAHGAHAEGYARGILFFLDLNEATGLETYLTSAQTIADEAIANLWYEGIFRGHQAKPYYEAVDGVGLLMDALVRLDQAVVPEPTAAVMIGAGASALLSRRGR